MVGRRCFKNKIKFGAATAAPFFIEKEKGLWYNK